MIITEIEWMLKKDQFSFKNEDMKMMSFLRPECRKMSALVKKAFIYFGQKLQLNSDEIERLNDITTLYTVNGKIPDFDVNTDRLDSWYLKVFKILEQLDSDIDIFKTVILKCLSIYHGQSPVERGFSISGNIVNNRESLSEKTFRFEKYIKDEIYRKKGAKNITVDYAMIKASKDSSSKWHAYLEEEKKRKEREREESQRNQGKKLEEDRKRILKENWNLELKNLDQQIIDNKSLLQAGQKNLASLLESSREKIISKPQADKFLKQAEETRIEITNIQEKLESLYDEKIGLFSRKPQEYAFLNIHFNYPSPHIILLFRD